MNELELIVFNVGHGLSVMLRELPSDYITLIDLGSDENLSPLEYLSKRDLYADQVFISHPHADHISEIEKITLPEYKPSGLIVQDYDWDDIISREQPYLRDKVKALVKVKKIIPNGKYSGDAELRYWEFTPDDAKKIFGDSKYINNSSLGIIYKWGSFKIAILGDLETSALTEFCKNQKFVEYAKGTNLLIAPHHGHSSGFPELWVEKIGKPNLTLISIKESDPYICKKYQSPDFNKGVCINGETRYTLTTRQDGSIRVRMWYKNNEPVWKFDFF